VDRYRKARDSPDIYDLKGCEYPSGFTLTDTAFIVEILR
jgi:hypothetical protein